MTFLVGGGSMKDMTVSIVFWVVIFLEFHSFGCEKEIGDVVVQFSTPVLMLCQ